MPDPRRAFPGEQNFTLEAANRQIESLIGVINQHADCIQELVGSGNTVTTILPGGGGGEPGVVIGANKNDLCDVEMQAWLWRYRP